MKLTDIPWSEKQLIVFFGKDVKNRVEQIRSLSKGFVDIFPEQRCFHPWEHVEFLEVTTKTIHRHLDAHWVIITNSAYIVDHLANLMQGAQMNADAKYTLLKNPEVFIAKEKVGAYVCSGGKIKNALPKKKDSNIIEWNDLSEVAEWLSDTYFEMEES